MTTLVQAPVLIVSPTHVKKGWQRIVLLSVLAYEGLGSLLGGSLLIAQPDGHLMDMPVAMMNDVFRDFLVPGFILFALGILNVAGYVAVLRRMQSGWIWAALSMGGLLFWFSIEIGILQELHWLHILWGLPVVFGAAASISLFPFPDEKTRRTLLVCGIFSSLYYIFLNLFVPLFWTEYDAASQTVSELSAIGAPTRLLWLLLVIPYTVLAIAFGIGVWRSAGANRSLNTAGVLLTIYGVLGIFWPMAPMHLRETLAAGGGTVSDTLHIVLASVTEVLFILALGFAAWSMGKPFRIFSMATFLILLFFGFLTFLEAPGIAANQPTPNIGTWERINIGVFLLWIAVLATALLKREEKASM